MQEISRKEKEKLLEKQADENFRENRRFHGCADREDVKLKTGHTLLKDYLYFIVHV